MMTTERLLLRTGRLLGVGCFLLPSLLLWFPDSYAAAYTRGHSNTHATVRLDALPDSAGVTSAQAAKRRMSSPGAFMSPQPVADFLALHDTNDRTPPDSHGAVGPDHLFVTLNTSVRVQSRDGALLHTAALSVFWSPLENSDPFDPRSAYDRAEDRWLTVACSRRDADASLLIGASATGDPEGEWHLMKIERPGDGELWVDYPSLGFNGRWVVVQVIMKPVGSTDFATSHIYVFDKADLYDGDGAAFTLISDDSIGEVQAPAIDLDYSVDRLYLVHGPEDGGSADHVRLFAIQGGTGSEQLIHVRDFEVSEPWATAPPGDGNFAPQKGLDIGLHLQEASMHRVVQRDGQLWFAHHIFLPADNPTRSAIQWWQVTPDDLVQRGRVDDPAGGMFFGYPSIAVNGAGDALIGYSQFSKETHASAGYSLRLATDPLGVMRRGAVLKEGQDPYFKTRATGRNRWGDYSATVVDPVDDRTFWTIQEYAAAAAGDPTQDETGRWGTWWGKIDPSDAEVFPGDSDNDGMPDVWERAYGLAPDNDADAALDGDQDGSGNLDEFLAGTDPGNPASVLNFTGVRGVGNQVQLRLRTGLGRDYVIERRTSDGEWEPVAMVAGNGDVRTIEVPMAPEIALFRARVHAAE